MGFFLSRRPKTQRLWSRCVLGLLPLPSGFLPKPQGGERRSKGVRKRQGWEYKQLSECRCSERAMVLPSKPSCARKIMNAYYQAYLNSEDWQKKRRKKLNRGGWRKRRCAICGARKNLDVHHLRYRADLTQTTQSELRILCRRCHDVTHKLLKAGKINQNPKSTGKIFSNTKNAVAYKLGIYPDQPITTNLESAPLESWQDDHLGSIVILNNTTAKITEPRMQTQADMFHKSKPKPKAQKIQINFDGGCSPNPGEKYGSFNVLVNGREVLRRTRVPFGFGTNNEAEWDALEMGLTAILGWFKTTNYFPQEFDLLIFTDSSIVRGRLLGMRSVWAPTIIRRQPAPRLRMIQHGNRCFALLKDFNWFEVTWNPRDRNVENFGH